MERSEPSLVPQWLKGASSGGVGGATHYLQTSSNHQDESGGAFALRQRMQLHGLTSGGSHVDYDAPRFLQASSDRAYYSAVRRVPGGGSAGSNDRALQDRETVSRGYTSFGRSTTYRSYDAGLDRSDRDTAREREWDWNRDERDRGRILGGFGGSDERERDRTEHFENSSTFRRSGSGQVSGARYEAEVPAPLRRVQSMGLATRALENGEMKAAEQGILPTAPPVNSGSLTSSMQKAAFERNFPSLGAQERGAVVSGIQSNVGNLVISSPRPTWQSSSTPRMDGIRSAASSPGLPAGGSPGSGLSSLKPGGSNGEVWSSALAQAPTVLNGTAVAPFASPGTVATPPTSSLANISVTENISNPLKMVEALVPLRVRTPPQYSAEKERLEERALMQSRQLIPMVLKSLGPSPRDKKVERAVHPIAPPSAIKPRQATGTSQVLNSPYRPPASRPEALKLGRGTGKILSRRVPIKEVVPALSPSVGTGLKPDPSPLAATAVGLPGLSGGSSATGVLVLNNAPRKQKQRLDRRAVPIPPVSVPVVSDGSTGGMRSKDGNFGILSGNDERRATAPTQNRVDFFNTLRRKAGLGGTPNIIDKLDVVPPKSSDIFNGEELGNALPEESEHLWEDVSEHPVVDLYLLENRDRQENDTTLHAEGPCSNVEHFGTGGKENDEILKGTTGDQLLKEADRSLQQQLARGEEVEIPFLISLGWNRAKAEATDALTQDEIDAFIQKRNELTSSPSAQQRGSNHNFRRMELQVGIIGSETSCVTSSDSDSEDDLQVQGG